MAYTQKWQYDDKRMKKDMARVCTRARVSVCLLNGTTIHEMKPIGRFYQS